MVARPAAIIFVNNDLTDNVQDMLSKQLHITNTMTGQEFDDLLISDPDFVHKVKQFDLRVLVIRSMEELTNRDKADVVCFFKNGLISVLDNNFGPPNMTLRVVDLYWGNLNIFGPP